MYKCAKCGSQNVQSKAWVNINQSVLNLTEDDIDFSLSEENGEDDNYCLDCEETCELIQMTDVESLISESQQFEESEPWNKMVCDNLRYGPYLKVWNNLPYIIRQVICESFNEYFKLKNNMQ